MQDNVYGIQKNIVILSLWQRLGHSFSDNASGARFENNFFIVGSVFLWPVLIGTMHVLRFVVDGFRYRSRTNFFVTYWAHLRLPCIHPLR